ncbi:MAG: CheR family methyltransferase [Aliidongia sp.]
MYFAPDRMRDAIDRIAQALAPGGFLFLGHAETLRGVSDDFHLCHTHDTFYYQRKDGALHREEPYSAPSAVSPTSAPGQGAVADFDGAWVDAIRSASERVAALVPGAGSPRRARSRAGPRRCLGSDAGARPDAP